ncbi:MAG: T9SS type A sorting domain-containing protein [Bacteroidales bacterium]|nr:T9SS type A sorting domain-containing protein [Bacteroidales bacterium]
MPYSTDFSDSDGWFLANGQATNGWHLGKPQGMTENAVFVSKNGYDTVFAYDKYARVFVYKKFQMGQSERITVEFDIRVGGGYYESDDYVKVYLFANDSYINPQWGNLYNEYFPYNYSSYESCGQFNETSYGISKYKGHVKMQIPNPNKGGEAYLVFLWRNEEHYQESSATQPAPIITNLSLKETPDNEVRLEKPKFSYCEVKDEATEHFVWTPGRDEKVWQVTLDTTVTPVTVEENSYDFANLTNHTTYTGYIRAKKGDYYSNWMAQEFYFNTDPEIWTHGPDSLSSDFARLTGAVTYQPGLEPKAFGLTYRKITETEWTYIEGKVSDSWDGHYEIYGDAENLQPFTWYTVGAWAVTKDGDTITADAEMAHSFITPDNYNVEATPLPYKSTFAGDDYWSLSKGFYNFYTDKPTGYTQNVLFVSPDGKDTAMTYDAEFMISYAQKVFKAPQTEYITVKMNLNVDGRHFMGKNVDGISVSATLDEVGGYSFWSSEPKVITKSSDGQIEFYVHNPVLDWQPPYGQEDEAQKPENFVLVIEWSGLGGVYGVDEYEKGDFAAIIRSIEISETPQAVSDAFPKCVAPQIYNVTTPSLTSAYFSWDNIQRHYQYKLNEDGEIVDETSLCNTSFTDLTPGTDYKFYLRYLCDDETWTDWTVYEFNTKALPELYTLPVNTDEDSQAELSAYLTSEFIQFNGIEEFGFEYQKSSPAQNVKAGDEWQKLPYAKIDTIRDDGYSCIYRIYAQLSNLDKNTEYNVREYAVTQNGFTVYSNERKFDTKSSALQNIENTLALNVYPNPASDVAVLDVKGLNSVAYVYVLDLQGRVLQKQMLGQGERSVALDVTDLPSGVYYVRLQTQKGSTTQKLVIK